MIKLLSCVICVVIAICIKNVLSNWKAASEQSCQLSVIILGRVTGLGFMICIEYYYPDFSMGDMPDMSSLVMV